MRYHKYFLLPAALLLSIVFFYPGRTYAQRTGTSLRAGEQRKAEKGLRDNRNFFYFLNTTITNFGTDPEKKSFREAAQRDIIAQLLFMKFLFRESYIEIRKAQRILINLYADAITRDIASARKLFNEIAPGVLESKSKSSIHYLELGYRDVKTAEVFMMMADNYTETLYPMRLNKYVEAVKLAKHGRRYGILALVDSRLDPEERKRFENPDFGRIKEKLSKYASPEKLDRYSLLHLDNYYLTKDAKSYYDIIWEKPGINEIEDYQRYLDEFETRLPEDSFGR